MVFLGVDWAEEHHDVCLLDEQGRVLSRARVANSLEGVGRIHALVADHSQSPDAVIVGIETDRGLLVQALLAAGYQIYAINPLAVARYRDRHSVSGAKSDAADAKVLADLVRTDRINHRAVAGDSQQVEAVKLLARAHQTLVRTRQRQVNQLRSALREFYPAALEAFKDDLGGRDAVAIFGVRADADQGSICFSSKTHLGASESRPRAQPGGTGSGVATHPPPAPPGAAGNAGRGLWIHRQVMRPDDS